MAKVTRKKKPKIIMTPWGIAMYPSLHQLDTEGKYATNKFKVDIEPIDPNDFARFKLELEDLLKTEEFDDDDPVGCIKTSKEGNEFIRLRTAQKPLGFDSRNQPLPPDLAVGGGSIIRAQGILCNYDSGYSLILLQYQVKELKVYGGRGSAFGTVDDGYEITEDTDEPVGSFGSTQADDGDF